MKRIYLILFIFLPFLVLAQEQLKFGILPEIAVNIDKPGRWSFSSKVESMHFLYESIDQENTFKHRYDQTDLQIFANYKLAVSWRFSAGYQYRIQDGENNHRLIQQLSAKQSFNQIRLGHRIRIDESFYKHNNPKFRLRYRLSSEFALQGSKLDPKEFYLKTSIEALFGFQSGDTELEGRINAMLGYYFENRNKFEVGLDYRTDNYIEEINEHHLWFKFGYIFNF